MNGSEESFTEPPNVEDENRTRVEVDTKERKGRTLGRMKGGRQSAK
jgi:hypothetical protein